MITKIMKEYTHRMENNLEIPPFLQKQIEGVWMVGDNFDRGIQLIIDGLQDEKYYLMELEEKYDR